MRLNQRFVIGLCPLAIAIVAALLLSVAPPARAQFFSHSGSVGTFPFNFFPINGAVSFYDMSGNTLFVGSSAPGSFSALAGALLKADHLTVGNGGSGSGSVTVSGSPTRIELGGTGNRLEVGNWGSGSMLVSAGALVDATLNAAACTAPGASCRSFIGNGAGSTGTLSVTGVGSEVRTLRSFTVGQAAVYPGFGTPGGTTNATLNVLNGGTLRTEGASVGAGPAGPNALGTERVFANVTVDGVGSQWIVKQNSVDANAVASFSAGTHANAQATITVSNGGKLLVDGSSSPGPFDFMNLGVNGGRVDMTVTGIGSSVEVKGNNPVLQVGRSGAAAQASFSVLAGASASAMFLNVGRDGARGSLLIDGTGSQLTLAGAGTPGVGGAAFGNVGRDGGNGSVTVSNGGRLLVTDGGADTRLGGGSPGVIVGRGAGGTGLLEIKGGGSKVEIVSSSLGLGLGVPDNFNPYMSLGRDVGSSGELRVSDGGKLLMTGTAITSLADQRYTGLVIGGRTQNVAGGVGRASITGAGSEVRMSGTDAYVSVGRGAGSQGFLDVLNKGHLESTGLDVGWTAGTGTMTINDATVRLSGGPFVDGGGAGMTIGAGAGSVGTVALNNAARISLSSDTAPFGINVGGFRTLDGGSGTLTMAGGSVIDYSGTAARALTIARSLGSTGSMTMTEASSVVLGSNGSLLIGRVVGATGELTMRTGSTLSANYVGVGSVPGVDTGTAKLILTDSTLTAATVEIGARGTLGGNNGTVNGFVINRGTLAPGESPGKIIINGGIRNEGDGQLVLDVQSDNLGGFLTDALILTKNSTFDFGAMKVLFNFVGDTDPNLFMGSGKFDMDNFLLSRDGQTDSGLSSVFTQGTVWSDVFSAAQFSATADGFDVTSLTFSSDGRFGVIAVAVPEPTTWAMLFLGVALLVLRTRSRVAAH